ncbi:MAG: assimilatory sulfite reductase (NADPH) flavoprotein subunit [Dokdonella sp.]|uniref:assimilatory sulfite reductase (NADPH) flavoprotein subunit n=1 Tax=Dokdonella sp. TaxID=2291710 RepID=UPI003F7FA230
MEAVSAVPPLPIVPLPEEKSAAALRLLEGLDAPALWWLSGYAAALARSHCALPQPAATAARDALAQARLTVVYGSQTGNARRLADQLARDAEAAGLAVRLVRAGAYPLRELGVERLLVIVISTQGDGDPPDDARGFVEFLSGKRAPGLAELRYAVLALGDSSYPQFCAIGRRVDARLAELGAVRLLESGEADVDIETVATPWLARALELAREALKPATRSATVTPLRAAAPLAPASEWTRARPFAAALLANQRIVARASARDVRPIELSLAGAGLAYEPGDALGIWPTNPPVLVRAVLEATGLDGDAAVGHDGRTLALRDWLAREREITRLARPFVAELAERARSSELNRLLAPDRREALAALMASHQPIDLLREHPAAWDSHGLVAALRPLAPRLYSIASSRKAVGDEAHLTVGVVAYDAFGTRHAGAASHFLAQAGDDTHVPVYVEPNERFRLPADAARDIVMIGPGTGVAPFRGFLQERREIGARGRHWLVFGNRHFRSEFLYQVEWQEALREGSLHRLDLAWSRDGARSYVQDRLREHGRDLYAWLDGGAHLYVCGDATRMAKDVHAALVDVFVEQGGMDRERAEERLLQLAEDGRYARDVY